MKSELYAKLKLQWEPVAISFTDVRPKQAEQFERGQRGCVASMLVAAASKGIVAVFDEETYGCAGGGVGLCFGNAFQKKNHPTKALLSTGDEALAQLGQTYIRSLGRGERFFATPELVEAWENQLPFTETPQKYVVFQPLSVIEAADKPDLVCIFANPDQLSALVILSGFYRGKSLNVVAPFASACQSILLAYQQIGEAMPHGVLGFFDISQRTGIPKDLLSFTVPFSMFQELEKAVPEGCLTTAVWEKLAKRL